MELRLQCSHMMWIVFVVVMTAVLTEVNGTARFISKNKLKNKTTRTMNAGNVNNNTMQKEKGKYKVPSSAKGNKTSIDHESLNNTKKTTTKSQAGTNMFSPTDNEQKNKTTVNMVYSADPTNSSLTTNNLTAFSHWDNSEHISLTVSLLVVTAVVVGLLFLCYCKRFKRKAKRDLERSSIPMLNEKIKKADEPVGEDTVLNVEVENINTPDTTEDEVDIPSAKTNSPVCVYEYTSKYNNNNMHPTLNDENVKVLAIGVL